MLKFFSRHPLNSEILMAESLLSFAEIRCTDIAPPKRYKIKRILKNLTSCIYKIIYLFLNVYSRTFYQCAYLNNLYT